MVFLSEFPDLSISYHKNISRNFQLK